MVKKTKNKVKASKAPEVLNKEGESVSRRSFLSRVWIGLGIVAFLQLIGGAALFLLTGRKQKKLPKRPLLDAGPIENFERDSVTLIGKGHLYVVRLKDGGFLAMSRKCTHLGCAVPWVEERKQFECPCHASVFSKLGDVLKPPATRALDLYEVFFDRNKVKIDSSHPIKRKKFANDQIAYPEGRG